MASIKMISEEEAIGKVKDVYVEIKAQLGIDFVPKPGYLEANWNKVKAVMVETGKLDHMTKEIVPLPCPPFRGAATD